MSSRGGTKHVLPNVVPNVFVAGMAHDFQVFSQLIGFSPTLFVWSKSYAPNNLSGKYFKLVETFLIVIVSQNVFSAEIDKPFFYKVFQLAPGGGGVILNHFISIIDRIVPLECQFLLALVLVMRYVRRKKKLEQKRTRKKYWVQPRLQGRTNHGEYHTASCDSTPGNISSGIRNFLTFSHWIASCEKQLNWQYFRDLSLANTVKIPCRIFILRATQRFSRTRDIFGIDFREQRISLLLKGTLKNLFWQQWNLIREKQWNFQGIRETCYLVVDLGEGSGGHTPQPLIFGRWWKEKLAGQATSSPHFLAQGQQMKN